MSSGNVCELRFQAGTSNKFYRIYQVSNGEHYLVLNWGRWGAGGQFKVERYDSSDALSAAAWKKRNDKANKGYAMLRDQPLPVVPQDILDCIEQDQGKPMAPSPTTATPVAVSVFDHFAADTDRLIRMLTGSPDVAPEAVVMRSNLTDQLAELRRRLQESEGQLELINDVISIKIGA